MKRTRPFSPDWKESIILPEATVRDALSAINRSGALMACATDLAGRLSGIITDSDVRRHLLSGGSLADSVSSCLNTNPVVALDELSESEILGLCETHAVRELPVCTRTGVLVDIFLSGQVAPEEADSAEVSPPGVSIPNSVFICAGGKGSRLSSIVNDRPKPLAIVGGKPLLNTVISHAQREGFQNFFVSVNHMAEMIEDHLMGPAYAGLRIRIVRETSPLGTAGAIGFVAPEINLPMLVTNADVLTTVPYRRILREHQKAQAWMTCVVRPHRYTVPFGILDVQNDGIVGIREKPTYSWLANSGIYVLSPEACHSIRRNERLDMTELMQLGIDQGKKIFPFFLHEYWVDVGQPDDFHRANREFTDHFGE